MGKLNVNRNIFLEKEELLRFQRFVTDENIATKVILDNTSKWGVVKTVFDAPSPDFLIEVGTNLGTVKIDNLSKAVTASKLLIEQVPIDNIEVPNDSLWYWVKISHYYSHLESGECTVNVNGEVSGVDTSFTECLRGQSTEVPVKIKFYKEGGAANTQIYEVVDVIDDQNLIIAGGSFTAESGLKYIVIGSTPISEVLTPEQEEGLYMYDSCLIEFIEEEITDTAPVTNYIEDEEFYIARVKNNSGTVTVQDKRGDQYLTFNVEGVADKLGKSQNLSDLTDKEISRSNLDVYSREEVENLVSVDDTNWVAMTRGSFVSTTDFTMKIRRVGKIVNIVGRMRIQSTPPPGTILASVNYSLIGISTKPETRVFYSAPIIESNTENKGVNVYIDETNPTTLNLIVINAMDTDDLHYYFNITFING